MIIDFLNGIKYIFLGFKLITQPGIRRFVILPLLINFCFFTVLMIFGISQSDYLIELIISTLPAWLQWIDWLLWPLFILLLVSVGVIISLMLASLFAAPFNGALAEAVEKQISSQDSGFLSDRNLFQEFIYSVTNESKKIWYFSIRAIPLLILLIIPVVNIIASFAWLMLSVWMLALEYTDHSMSNHGLSFQQIRTCLLKRKSLVFGFGLGTLAIVTIPIINFFIIPAGVAGATLMVVKEGLLDSINYPDN